MHQLWWAKPYVALKHELHELEACRRLDGWPMLGQIWDGAGHGGPLVEKTHFLQAGRGLIPAIPVRYNIKGFLNLKPGHDSMVMGSLRFSFRITHSRSRLLFSLVAILLRIMGNPAITHPKVDRIK